MARQLEPILTRKVSPSPVDQTPCLQVVTHYVGRAAVQEKRRVPPGHINTTSMLREIRQ